MRLFARGLGRNALVASFLIFVLGQADALGASGAASAKLGAARDDPLTSPRTRWWREAKFGMFIHWGIYAVPAGEWKGKPVGGIAEWIMHRAKISVPEYEKIAKEFNPVKFDAAEWVAIAKRAGMKYIVITSKHHDGFSMFDSELTGYDVVDATPWKRDPMKELARACRKEGIKFCFYHSILDWHHPDQNRDFPRYVRHMKGQLKELVTQYGPLGILWFDGDWIGQWDQKHGRDLYGYVRRLQPDIIINDRVGKRKGGDGDYATPEQHIPKAAMKGRLWETCMTINRTWGYCKHDRNWKPTRDLVRKLIDIVSKGGNFLLNVGPTAEGVIPQPSVERLLEMGNWLEANGEAVYGATMSPFEAHPFDGRCTVKGNTLYLHVFTWPQQGVRVAGLEGEIVRVEPLDKAVGAGKHEVTEEDGRRVLIIPKPQQPDPFATVIAVRFRLPPRVAAAPEP